MQNTMFVGGGGVDDEEGKYMALAREKKKEKGVKGKNKTVERRTLFPQISSLWMQH